MRRRTLAFQTAVAVAASIAAFEMASVSAAGATSCGLSAYKAVSGLVAANASDGLRLLWDGEQDQQLCLRLGIDGGTPTIRDLSVRRKNGEWATLATNVTPE